MQTFDVLSIMSQLAIAITGFSGVTSVFGAKGGATFGNFMGTGQTLIFFYIFSVGGALVITLASVNALLLGMFWPFMYCIVWYLIESSFVFVRLTLRRVAPDVRTWEIVLAAPRALWPGLR